MIFEYPYEFPDTLFDTVTLVDHLTGFSPDGNNSVLTYLNDYCTLNNTKITVNYHQILESQIQDHYPNLDFKFDLSHVLNAVWNKFLGYTQHPEINYKNFICSFNGSAHVSRKLLVAILHRFGWFDPETCSKNFTYHADLIDGHLGNFLDVDQHRIYRKFFIGNDTRIFFDKIYSFGLVQYDHASNIYNLEHKLTQSFLHIVSETLATSYYPFVTEKFLYSVVTRGLFLAYAQPGWHDHLERYYGFRRYTRLFDYRFDSIQNPVERLVELMSMIAKFSVLSSDDWRDLYEMEIDIIEYNYEHFFSGDYKKFLTNSVMN